MEIAFYQNFGEGRSRVAYVIDGNKVYFCGLDSRGTSTINAAARVIEAIMLQERRTFLGLEFYDFQTGRGYQQKPRGWYEVDRVHLVPRYDQSIHDFRPEVERWEPVGSHHREGGVPEHVLGKFRHLIV